MNKVKDKIEKFIEKILSWSILKSGLAFLICGIVLLMCNIRLDSIPMYIEYFVYAVSFYFLVVFSVAVVRDGIPALLHFGEGLPIVGQLIINIKYRQRFFLYMGGIGNILFVLFYFLVAWYYESKWFFVIGLYNLSIGVLRGYLSRMEHRLRIFIPDNEKTVAESKITKNAAKMLFIMNSIITIMGLRIIFKDDTFEYNFIILYALALYVFGRLIFMIVTILQKKPHNDGIWKVVQLINLATALVSMFTFQTALLHNYEPSVAVREKYNAITGFLVCCINMGIVIWLYSYANKLINKKKKIKKKKPNIRKGFRWVYVIGTIVVIGGVMGFGLIGAIFFDFNHHSSILMLMMVPIMSFIYAMAMKPVIRNLSDRINNLTDAMNQVSNGNLDYQIDVNKAGEFTTAYNQFNAMTLELKKTKEEMESFTNEFAHEFKTPITAISGFSDYLLDTAEDIESPERIEQLQMISEESKRLLNLSMNTLLQTKVDAMQVIENEEKYDLAEQLRKNVILLSKELDKKDIDLKMDEDLSLPFYGNEELLQHVWINLLNNAIKFTPSKGNIMIEGIKDEENVIVKISDSGVGMDEKTMARIFEKYYQNDSTNIARGSGIGLSIVKRIVTLCEGTIDVESCPGMGTTFIVKLPVKSE